MRIKKYWPVDVPLHAESFVRGPLEGEGGARGGARGSGVGDGVFFWNVSE